MTITREDLEAITQSVVCALDQRRMLSDSEHHEHHAFIATQIEAAKNRADFWEEMKRHVAKFGAISVITAIGAACWFWLRHHV